MGGTRGQPTLSAQEPTASSSTPARPHSRIGSLPPPNAFTQYMMWARCRREGIPARLVLDTDGVTEEICLWFRLSAASNIGGGAADNVADPKQTGKRRRERARRRRRQEGERGHSPTAMPTPGVATGAATASFPSTLAVSPPTMAPPACDHRGIRSISNACRTCT